MSNLKFLNPPDQKEIEKKAEPLEGILKFHSIFINSDGQLRGSELSCLYCSVKERCSKCNEPIVKRKGRFTKNEKYQKEENVPLPVETVKMNICKENDQVNVVSGEDVFDEDFGFSECFDTEDDVNLFCYWY